MASTYRVYIEDEASRFVEHIGDVFIRQTTRRHMPEHTVSSNNSAKTHLFESKDSRG
jgi:hypothetical protein